MKLLTKFWKVLDLDSHFPDEWYYVACKGSDGKVHTFGLGSGFSHATISERVAKEKYCFCEEKPLSYIDVIKILDKINLTFSLEEIKRVYKDEVVS